MGYNSAHLKPQRFFVFDPLAQLVEQLPFKEWALGSNPRRVTTSQVIFFDDCLD